MKGGVCDSRCACVSASEHTRVRACVHVSVGANDVRMYVLMFVYSHVCLSVSARVHACVRVRSYVYLC